VYKDYGSLTLAITMAALFGADTAAPEARRIVAAIEKAFDFFARRGGSAFALPEWLPSPENLEFGASVQQLDRVGGQAGVARDRGGGGGLLLLRPPACRADTAGDHADAPGEACVVCASGPALLVLPGAWAGQPTLRRPHLAAPCQQSAEGAGAQEPACPPAPAGRPPPFSPPALTTSPPACRWCTG
jgi:hypothetical protein